MVTTAIITGLSVTETTTRCSIHIPYFDSSDMICPDLEAVFITSPGISGGYKVNDIVIVAFYENELNSPIILGKLVSENLSNFDLSTESIGTVYCNTLHVTKNASLPIDTVIEYNNDTENVSQNQDTYKSIRDVIEKINQPVNSTGIANISDIIALGGNLPIAQEISSNVRVIFDTVAFGKEQFKGSDDYDGQIKKLRYNLGEMNYSDQISLSQQAVKYILWLSLLSKKIFNKYTEKYDFVSCKDIELKVENNNVIIAYVYAETNNVESYVNATNFECNIISVCEVPSAPIMIQYNSETNSITATNPDGTPFDAKVNVTDAETAEPISGAGIIIG